MEGCCINAGCGFEIATSTFSPCKSFSHGEVNLVPTGVLEEREGKVGYFEVGNCRGGHVFIEENTPFPMAAQTSRCTLVFEESLGSAASEVGLDPVTDQRSCDVRGVDSVDWGVLDSGRGEGCTSGVDEILEETTTQTKNVGEFVHGYREVAFECGEVSHA